MERPKGRNLLTLARLPSRMTLAQARNGPVLVRHLTWPKQEFGYRDNGKFDQLPRLRRQPERSRRWPAAGRSWQTVLMDLIDWDSWDEALTAPCCSAAHTTSGVSGRALLLSG